MERDLLISLVTKAQKGDSAAMDELFAHFYNDVYYFALKTVTDSDIACDITQETFLEIIHTIGNLREPAAFVTWMKQITYHQCTRYFRKKKDVLVEEDEDGNTIFDNLADESEGSIPSEVYEKEDFRNTILGIINELTEEQRSAVMMYYFDELTVGQIAQIQGVSEGTVKSRLNYARKAIKKSVEAYEKKHNIRLHSFSFLPLFLLFFGKELMPAAKAAEIGSVVSEAASAVATGSAVVGGTTAAVSAEATATTAGTGIAAKIAAMPIVTKMVAGIAAALIVFGGGAAVIGNRAEEHAGQAIDTCVDENHDCICDTCSAGIHFINGVRYFGKAAHDAVCDDCGMDLGFWDEDMDSICDVCGEYPCGDVHHAGHGDENSDVFCANCGSRTVEPDNTGTTPPENQEIYWELDGLCDACGAVWNFQSCLCSVCDYQKHTHGQGSDCGKCTVCGGDLLIIDLDGWGKCDLCGETQCENNHHLWQEGVDFCFICGRKMDGQLQTLEAPVISITVDGETAIVTITPVEGAIGYEMRINGNHMGDGRYDTTTATITVTRDMLAEGENTIVICAYNHDLYSPDSNAITVGKLTDPEYLVTGTGIEFPWGDVEHAQGYMIYGEDGEYLATIGLGEGFDFASIYTEDGFYFPYIQAYAEGWISSQKCGIPVSVGSNGGPVGTP